MLLATAVVFSFIAGFVDAIAGGGGVITVPALLILGLPIDQVLGTSKLISTCGTMVAARNFISSKQYSTFVLRTALYYTAVGALIGSLTVALIDPAFLKPFISVLIITIAVYFFLKPQLGIAETIEQLDSKKKFFILCAALGIGFYDGFFGPGTGAFLMFVFVRLAHQDFLRATGNTKILNLTSNVVALIVFILAGKVIWSIGLPMAFANMIGGYFGARYAMQKGASMVRWIFIVMAVIVSAKQLL